MMHHDPYEDLLAVFASRPSQSKGRLVHEEPSSTRNAFQRDRDRVIHSSAFRRLKYKTQVFVFYEGDHFRTRLTHTLEVAQIARSIARALHVQEDLAEVVALAHDLGHPPFAHTGEDALQEAMHDFGGFDHNDQSLRIVTKLEKRYAEFEGLNLTWEVLEGLAKHNGPVTKPILPPTIAELDQKFDLRLKTWPSIEAQIGNLSDDIAYNNHDIDDGLRAGHFMVKDLYALPILGAIAQEMREKYPKLERTRLANEIIRRFMGLMIDDVLAETRKRLAKLDPQSPEDIRNAGEPVVAFSAEFMDAVSAVRKFLMENMYRNADVNRVRRKTKRIVKDLFDVLMAEPECLPKPWQARILENGNTQEARSRAVLDYVSGMTDRYAMQEHKKLFDPYAIQDLPSV